MNELTAAAMDELWLESHDGVALRVYRSAPAADKPALLIVLPATTTAALIGAAVERLARNFSVITWETRLVLDPAPTADEAGAMSLHANVGDLESVFRYFELSRAYLIGYCTGAPVALHAAARHPGWFPKLALVNGSYFMQPGECELTQHERDILKIMPHIAAGETNAASVSKTFVYLRDSGKLLGDAFALETYRPFYEGRSLHRLGLLVEDLIRNGVRPVAREIAVPALVTAGRNDAQTHCASSVLLRSELRDAELYLDGGDHYAFCRGEARLMERIAGFFGEGADGG
jgi:pimeloyl-ACP methyl ester carboxylesterase